MPMSSEHNNFDSKRISIINSPNSAYGEQMTAGANANPTFDEVFKRNVKRVLTHWTPFTVILVFLGTFIASLSLYTYARAIGRPDLFMAALDAKASLAAWMIMVMALMFTQVIVLMGSSWFYGAAVSLFTKVRWHIRSVALRLLIPQTVGYAVLIGLGFYQHEDIGAPLALGSTAAATLLAYGALFLSKSFRRLVAYAALSRRRSAYYGLIIFTGFILVMSVWVSLLSILLIINTYVGVDTKQAVDFVASFSLLTLLMNLVPALLYFVVRGSIYKKAATVAIGAALVFLVFLVTAQGAMSSITYSVAGSLDMRQRYSTRFVLDESVTLADVDPILWQSHLRADGRVQVRAFQMFAFGDLLLLCPASLMTAKLHELPVFTPLCFFTRSSQVKRLPPRLLLGKTTLHHVGHTAWRQMADCLMQGTKRSETCTTSK